LRRRRAAQDVQHLRALQRPRHDQFTQRNMRDFGILAAAGSRQLAGLARAFLHAFFLERDGLLARQSTGTVVAEKSHQDLL